MTTFGGGIRLDKEVTVNGDLTVFGGEFSATLQPRLAATSPGWVVPAGFW